MSVEIAPYSRTGRISESEETGVTTTIRYAPRLHVSVFDSVRIRSASAVPQPVKRKAKEKILRRLNGFLIEEEGDEYKVAFVEDNHLVFYYLPLQQLRKAGIVAVNQPFQMDEVEIELSGGRVATGYVFCPLAKPADVFSDAIELTDERRQRLSAIIKKFGNA